MEFTKQCGRCNLIKSVCDFNRSTRDGYMSKCKVCCVEDKREWVNNNREHVNEYLRNSFATNPSARIANNMHRRLNHILHRGSYSTRTEHIIGLNKPTYLEWLNYNFEENMCWANYGIVWCFDLIIPASAYDLTDEVQLLSCFNWKNIRPCIKKDNAVKFIFICQFTIANHSIRVLGFIRKMRQIRIEHFLRNIE